MEMEVALTDTGDNTIPPEARPRYDVLYSLVVLMLTAPRSTMSPTSTPAQQSTRAMSTTR
jgi:hypothetical protein